MILNFHARSSYKSKCASSLRHWTGVRGPRAKCRRWRSFHSGGKVCSWGPIRKKGISSIISLPRIFSRFSRLWSRSVCWVLTPRGTDLKTRCGTETSYGWIRPASGCSGCRCSVVRVLVEFFIASTLDLDVLVKRSALRVRIQCISVHLVLSGIQCRLHRRDNLSNVPQSSHGHSLVQFTSNMLEVDCWSWKSHLHVGRVLVPKGSR